MQFIKNDGGRAAAGYKCKDDCVTRAIAVATGLPYERVYDIINGLAQQERRGKRKKGISHAGKGVYKQTYHKLLTSMGWKWTPTMGIGTGCTVHLRAEELPKGRLIVSLSKHLCAVIDGVIHDLSNPDRGGTRCVYGYWQKP